MSVATDFLISKVDSSIALIKSVDDASSSAFVNTIVVCFTSAVRH